MPIFKTPDWTLSNRAFLYWISLAATSGQLGPKSGPGQCSAAPVAAPRLSPFISLLPANMMNGGKKIMDKPLVKISYKLANGSQICVEVSTSVQELLEQSDRQIRSQRRQDRRHIDFLEYIDELTDPAMINPQSDPADLVIRMESYRQLYAAIDKLSEVQRRRLLLYIEDNLTYRQIAKLEGVNKSAIGQSIDRAIEQLYKLLTD